MSSSSENNTPISPYFFNPSFPLDPWEWATEAQDKLSKCEISWRYTRAEISWLERNNKVPDILDINNISFRHIKT
ncbi:MAG: hypothetical protein KGD58_09585 [Candidatus Lokiarchaeota archaeon]|nr:hypothetical protein [Candidatus Lokiarchaeota archaeon]